MEHDTGRESTEHDHGQSGHDEHGAGHPHDMSGMAVGATLHCLTGCSIGEIIGLLVGTAAGWANLPTMVLSIALAFVFGYALSALPLVRGGIALSAALGLVLAADTLSIVTMEIVDNLVMLVIPGAMNAGLVNPIFWISMAISLTVAFFVAWPVNRALLRRGKGHAVTHHALGADASMDNRPLVIGISAFLLGGFIASVGTLLG
ncbi:DUF4396 domain-containing protein [Arthrobacter sp. JSM 101049]|uniref:DUF4396 domain-containing protein n=1 Tax=Arthrobacter sp. JSM 101049 TaxID=929097 RepID=UPI0035686852